MSFRSLSEVAASLLLVISAAFPHLVEAVRSPSWNGPKEIPIVPPYIPHEGDSNSVDALRKFTLRHIHLRGTYQFPDLHVKYDVTPDAKLWIVSEDTGVLRPVSEVPKNLSASSRTIPIQRLKDRRPSVIEAHLALARSSGTPPVLAASEWSLDEVVGPNVEDKNTVLSLAQMAANDYIKEPWSEEWQIISGPFNYSSSFGWQDDGLRGHIYADENNSTVIISIKGTSAALFDGAETTTNDKLNDNLYFSCCCGQGGSFLVKQACDCATGTYTGNLTCIVEEMLAENRYYRAAIDLYKNVTAQYPHSDVWLTGHSLGGSMSALLGHTFGLPTVTFESIPDALPASRLGLPAPPGHDPRRPQSREFTGVYHFGHTADPVYIGTCNGATSPCTWYGYALESSCHTGLMCVYDTVEDKGWRVGIGTHRILSVIKDVLEAYDSVPPCLPEKECVDCELWKFFRSNGSEITTSPAATTTTKTSTRTTTTSTCKTPGWWGCLDETTTTGSTSPSTTSTTSTCKTPGWFGCKDPTTTTTVTGPSPTVTITDPPSSTTSTCRTPGWFWCLDPTSTTSTTTTCETPGFFWGCWDTTAFGQAQAITPASAFP
ncbi:hypothetical protein VTN31DRAFT_3145 [Thermomyces dupontii]|uniref:uncharacterized protein n=1 Tax=Talaromyces thermophilus TaxID=28565 RepID=UPI0037425E82